jgi:anti-sigma factor ChrR (cupin superfamily)
MRFAAVVAVAGLLTVSAQGAAFAACSLEQAMTKVSAISDVLMPKMQSKPDEAAKIMSEIGEATSSATPTDQDCTALDRLMERARRL